MNISLFQKMIEAKIAENAKKQEASQRRQREERQKRMQDDLEQERAKIAAYEDELRVRTCKVRLCGVNNNTVYKRDHLLILVSKKMLESRNKLF